MEVVAFGEVTKYSNVSLVSPFSAVNAKNGTSSDTNKPELTSRKSLRDKIEMKRFWGTNTDYGVMFDYAEI